VGLGRGGHPTPAARSFPTCGSDSILTVCTAGRPDMSYTAPVADMRFVLEEVAELDRLATLPGYEAASPDLVDAILDEAARLAGNELAPLNQPADRAGSVLENGVVRTPAGFREAYTHYVEGGWNGLAFDPEYGGQGLPLALAIPVA